MKLNFGQHPRPLRRRPAAIVKTESDAAASRVARPYRRSTVRRLNAFRQPHNTLHLSLSSEEIDDCDSTGRRALSLKANQHVQHSKALYFFFKTRRLPNPIRERPRYLDSPFPDERFTVVFLWPPHLHVP